MIIIAHKLVNVSNEKLLFKEKRIKKKQETNINSSKAKNTKNLERKL
jgi:hypothetical protein